MEKTVRKRISPSPKQRAQGNWNIFSDLALPNPNELRTKLRLAYAINRIAELRRMTQASTANVLGVPQPRVSSLKNYKLDGFSVERLMVFITALGHDVEIAIRKRPAAGGGAKVTVVAT